MADPQHQMDVVGHEAIGIDIAGKPDVIGHRGDEPHEIVMMAEGVVGSDSMGIDMVIGPRMQQDFHGVT